LYRILRSVCCERGNAAVAAEVRVKYTRLASDDAVAS
jgi:hypothetical protein